jgi:hypothetical protein
VRAFTIDERRNRRARRHFLSAGDAPPITMVVAGLVGLHATDPATPVPLDAVTAGSTRR